MLTLSQFQNRISEVFATCHLMNSSCTELNERIDRFVNSEVNRKTKSGRNVYDRLTKGFVMGQIHLQHELILKHMEFCYTIDGKLYTTSKVSDKPKVEQFYGTDSTGKINSSMCGHYWFGTDKLYY